MYGPSHVRGVGMRFIADDAAFMAAREVDATARRYPGRPHARRVCGLVSTGRVSDNLSIARHRPDSKSVGRDRSIVLLSALCVQQHLHELQQMARGAGVLRFTNDNMERGRQQEISNVSLNP